ncbi:hypothetical protein LQ954_13850 [Sphingomonas sp. IC-11]|jgi:hypothetical protein|uniref:hypothetical protein n=1 Tax=Sphingomonas sp. IC-11 TaxID=2898528 RepID=UPI001E60C702|nr:hypothetical protein [Sphingomonas sp. IC-11]MCD2317226.1 hypothetical protein [Sphingomonas sp. IC-11]
MSAGTYKVSYSALAQLALLPAAEKAELTRLFSSSDMHQPELTRATSDGRFVSKVGSKRVLWRRAARQKPEILSIVDQSFARA